MSERRPGDWLRRGRFGLTEAERWNADHDVDLEIDAYLEQREASSARKRHPCVVEYNPNEASEAERIQSPESAG